MPFAGTTTKNEATALTLTPTGGTTHTIELFRSLAVNRNLFRFSEDTSSAYRGEVTLTADPSTPKGTDESGAAIYKPGVSRMVHSEVVVSAVDSQRYTITGNYSWTVDEYHVSESQIQAFLWKSILMLGSTAILRLISRRQIA